jgi:2-polyprenyl-6-methoxyphenol hydroxylase-like FAD-dependent oxidoreductase
MSEDSSRPQVLIVGAGPTGLVLALWLSKLGVRVRVIDKASTSGTTSRALAVQARTLEFYQQIGLAHAVVELGHKVDSLNLWVRSQRVARVPIAEIGRGLSPFPYPLIFPQDEHELLLIERLREIGIAVERGVELTGFEQTDATVRATLLSTDGATESFSFDYLAGCDGARSMVREILNTGFPGGTYDHLFYVADVEAAGPPMDGGLHVDLDAADFLAVFPLRAAGRARLIGSIRDDVAKDHERLQFSDVQDRAMENLKVNVSRVNWFSTYRVHHRVAQNFRQGRVFLLGDAAHIHSPVGGQGMNTGIGDAINLAWKLASSFKHPENHFLLDTYEPERIAFARRLVATTDAVFKQVLNPSVMARFVRTKVVPVIVPAFFRLSALRRLVFKAVSQIELNYRASVLSSGKTGKLRGGDRLPWVSSASPDGDNFAPLASLDWQIHVYGNAAPKMKSLSEGRGIRLHEFAWHRQMSNAGLVRDAVYLLRPDGYIAVTHPRGDAAAVASYLDERRLQLANSFPFRPESP